MDELVDLGLPARCRPDRRRQHRPRPERLARRHGARITAELDPRFAPLRADTTAILRNKSLLGGLAAGLSGRGQELGDAIGWAAPASANLARLITVLDGQRSQLQQLISSGGEVLNAVGQRQGVLHAAVNAGQQVLAVTAARNDLGNPLVIPVTPPGTGAPPCKVQGPWTFNKISADFPHLTQAPR